MTRPDCTDCAIYCARNWRWLDWPETDKPKDYGPEESCTKWKKPKPKGARRMEDEARKADAIRELVNAMRSDMRTVAVILAHMNARGYTADETQEAVNEVASRHHTPKEPTP